jgi:hypothetical protein
MESVCIFYRVFEFGGFTGSFFKEAFTSSYLVFYLLLLLGFFGLHWIDIFLSFSKSPSLLKSESGCESYCIFRETIFCRFRARFGPEIQPKINRKVAELFFLYFRFSFRFDRKSHRKFSVSTGLWTGLAQPGPDVFLGWLGLVSVPGSV